MKKTTTPRVRSSWDDELSIGFKEVVRRNILNMKKECLERSSIKKESEDDLYDDLIKLDDQKSNNLVKGIYCYLSEIGEIFSNNSLPPKELQEIMYNVIVRLQARLSKLTFNEAPFKGNKVEQMVETFLQVQETFEKCPVTTVNNEVSGMLSVGILILTKKNLFLRNV